MKKITVLLLMATMFAYNTKAQETKQQFVKWETVPPANDVKVVWLKNAMQGKSIPGATVRSTAATYKAVWGEALYNKVLAAEDTRFNLYQAKGGEINWAVGANGAAVQSGVLAENVLVVSLDGQEIAKWGTNGCLNALSAPSYTADGDDPDNKKPGSKTAANTGGMSMTNGSNSITFSGSTGPNANEALFYFKDGLQTQQASEDASAIRFMAISSNAVANAKLVSYDCNSCGSSGTTSGTTSIVYAAPPSGSVSASNNGYTGNTNSTLTVINKANGWDKINTAANVLDFGLNVYTAIHGQKVILPNQQIPARNGGYFNNRSTLFQPPNSRIASTVANIASGDNTWTVRTNAIE